MKRLIFLALGCTLSVLLMWSAGCNNASAKKDFPDPYGTKPPLAPAPDYPK